MKNKIATANAGSCPLCSGKRSKTVGDTTYAGFHGDESYTVHIVQCKDCGFVYQDPRLNDRALDAYYGSHDTYFDTSHLETPLPVLKRYESVHRFVAEHMKLPPKPSLLDVGTFLGQFPAFMREKGFTVAGIDINARSEEMGKRRGFSIRRATLADLAGSGERYDLITLNHLLEHLSDLAVLKIARGLLHKNGALFIEVPNVEDIPRDAIGYFTAEHLSYFSPATLTRLMARYGFSLYALELRAGRITDAELGSILALFAPAHEIRQPLTERERIVRVLRSLKGKEAYLWGSGFHSKMLMGLYPLDIAGLIDSSPERQGKTLFGKKIHAPSDVNPACILVSSFGSEKEIAAAARKMFPEAEVVTLYEAEPSRG
ncbi:hypothetical protein A3C21_04315 [Candidatus Kaiserbacteria bacterium RIFCSPHIGHO2_02_FULL_59_21]|uniref:Methyltransferase type 11 n=2 Tax=Candidatus Kaiseribacteriota TaxID=1752734 RepID=A0A0G2AZY7_9BACT|nr:MAG: Methyltransferase type 11 [Candidatus Kaiserbacteria bacterium GW2011_GWA2_58_9]OGG62769.1 MAG: hypothetical protein A2766_02735 [Candidatus Kaiserbacteria bacterium RIFCSPHIGHO2_01_FULL_58_22]OGG67157.1 MAG: hypothetical protein A3C21_04315 [Candidatus Kaiserbacteria bacterium RIFCSPHIGHO2_02_FULL_59_21]OGG79046.1 MAG: hypothetical protein A2952_03005 [Candidatus Kaiserbacteria bacterium RIFCSPLOWO2_01_FULL_59_34]OGG86390.1 MAG: hypothetical protein A3I47_01015 [Candidatus Kaiserbacter